MYFQSGKFVSYLIVQYLWDCELSLSFTTFAKKEEEKKTKYNICEWIFKEVSLYDTILCYRNCIIDNTYSASETHVFPPFLSLWFTIEFIEREYILWITFPRIFIYLYLLLLGKMQVLMFFRKNYRIPDKWKLEFRNLLKEISFIIYF